MRALRVPVMQELEAALSRHAPPPVQDDPSRHELPPLVIDGIPTPVEKMTQAQLRAFIPLMLKYSTGELGVQVLGGGGRTFRYFGDRAVQCAGSYARAVDGCILDSGGMSSQSFD